MKKEVITVRDGKQFKENFEKILKQAKGKELYIDVELIPHTELDVCMCIVSNTKNEIGYLVFVSTIDSVGGFRQIHKVSNRLYHREDYSNPCMAEKAVLVMLA